MRAATMSYSIQALLLALCAICSAYAYYIPGTYPKEFVPGENMHVEVNSLSSFETELPYDYYSLPFCKPKGGVQKSTSSVNPGTILSGLRMFNSPYVFKVHVPQKTLLACPEGSAGPLTAKQVADLKDKITNRYRVRMVLDNMPITTFDLTTGSSNLRPGFELGAGDPEGDFYIFNHLAFNVLVHKTHGEFTRAQNHSPYTSGLVMDAATRKLLRTRNIAEDSLVTARDEASGRLLAWPEGTPREVVDALHGMSGRSLAADDKADKDKKEEEKEEREKEKQEQKKEKEEEIEAAEKGESMWMVVGFEVMPCSIKREKGDKVEFVKCNPWGDPTNPEPQRIYEGADIIYTYDVYWTESSIEWASRWDAYLSMPNGSVHWFSILNSLLVVMVMSVIVAVILMRTVRRDLAKYEELLVEGQDAKEESGWKLISGDVFRAPPGAVDLAVQVGSGAQILCTAVVTLLLAAAGFLSPAARGSLLTVAIVLYLLLAITAGYIAVVLWSNMQRSITGGTSVCLKTACYFPGITFAVFTLLNMLIHTTGTSGAVPLTMYFSLVALWFVISIPMTYIGGFFAFRAPLLTWPTRTNLIPRHIPPPPAAADPYVLYAAAGILPFCTVFIELYFAMSSMWQGYFYYLFGFLFIVAFLMILITAEVSILCTYVQLCAEDYQWWWRSFHRGGAISLYTFIYAFIFLYNGLPDMHGLSVVLYLGYMLVVILAMHLAMGTIGFLSSLGFVYSIFAAVKAD